MKRTISMLLALLMAAGLVSCGGGNGDAAETTTNAETSSETTTVTTVEEIKPPVDKSDYEGATFNILAPEWGLYTDYFFADEQNGEAMNDALFERDSLVEEQLNIDVTHTFIASIDDIPTTMSTVVMSDDNSYQLVLAHCITGISKMLTQGLLYDFNDFEYCDLDADYWNTKALETLAINGHAFYGVSDYMIADPNAIFFDKSMIEEFSLDNPYELVRSGDWTLEKMIEMASAATADLNGDGVFDDNDRYGYSVDDGWISNSFMYSSGISLVEKDSNGDFTVTLNNEKMVKLVELYDQLVNKSGDTYITTTATRIYAMTTGRFLFEANTLNRLKFYRETEEEFGILPYPKLEASQDKYETNDWSGLMCVPVTVGNPEMVGKAIELLSFFSTDTVLPAYFDVVLDEKMARDTDSKEMLDIIFDGIVFDPGVAYTGFSTNMLQLFYTLSFGTIRKGESNFASWYATYGDGAQAEIDKFAADAAKLDE